MDLLNPATEKQTLLAAIKSLGEIGSSRALSKLKSSFLVDHEDKEIRQAVASAVTPIETEMNLAQIKKGNIDSIRWGQDIIANNNGSKKQTTMAILEAFKIAKKAKPTVVKMINDFVRLEINSGYHDYDQELMAKMNEVLKSR
jgi:hypothetical protein